MMNFEDYHQETSKTAIYPGAGTASFEALAYVGLGLAGEAGEVANKLKKVARDHSGRITPGMREKLAGELGDVFWYLSMLLQELRLEPGKVLANNNAKLTSRKEQGKIWGDGDTREEISEPVYAFAITFSPSRGVFIGCTIAREFVATTEERACEQLYKHFGSDSVITRVIKKPLGA
jgi:NTP pyrophosphatase (non-canonical NTP hydrolase)